MAYLHEVSATFQEAAIKESKSKLTKLKRRREELSTLIKKLYESYALDKIPENHFEELLKGYDTEQQTLDSEITHLQSEIDFFNTESVKADKFIELVNRHTEFTTFSAVLLNEFIEKVIIHEAVKINGRRTQQVDIYLNYIGKFELPASELPAPLEPPPLTASRGRKLRCYMTEEELMHKCAVPKGNRSRLTPTTVRLWVDLKYLRRYLPLV